MNIHQSTTFENVFCAQDKKARIPCFFQSIHEPNSNTSHATNENGIHLSKYAHKPHEPMMISRWTVMEIVVYADQLEICFSYINVNAHAAYNLFR